MHKLVEGDEVWAQAKDNRQYNNAGYCTLAGHLVHLD